LLPCGSLCGGPLLRLLRSRRLLPCGRFASGALLRLLARRFGGCALFGLLPRRGFRGGTLLCGMVRCR
jgi:hypothetical protein